jgi:acyl-CoA thioesterase-1
MAIAVSKRTALVFAVAVLGLAAAALWLREPVGTAGPVVNSPPPNRRIAMLGDSMTSGMGAARGNDLPAQLGRLLGRKVRNWGVAGETTGGALETLPRLVAPRPGTVIVFLGGNDVLQKVPDEEAEANLRRIVETCQRAGSMVALIGIQGRPGDGYTGMYERLAYELGCVFIPDVLDGIFFNPKLKADAIHPNDAGYALIAERIAEALEAHL